MAEGCDPAKERSTPEFAADMGEELRSIRSRRRHAVLEMALAVAAALLLAGGCIVFLLR